MPWALDVAARAESTVKTCSCVLTPDAPTQCRNSSPRRRWHGRQRSQRRPSAHAWMLATRAGKGGRNDSRGNGGGCHSNPSCATGRSLQPPSMQPHATRALVLRSRGCIGKLRTLAARVIALLGESLARGTTSVAGVSSNRRSGDERRWAAFGWALTACLRSSAWSRPFFPSPPARRPSPRPESRTATKAF